ncbi:MAG TPA: TolC family protein [Bryobacteraceae bacterium]|nr:TolC family protein [Bryobacteraceae bacterium]
MKTGVFVATRRSLLAMVLVATGVHAQGPPVSADRPWHGADERGLAAEAGRFRPQRYRIDSGKTYSLAELIDLAEAHNPETRVAWENARAQAAGLGIARSELYPALSAAALSGVDREEVPLGTRFYRFTDSAFELSLDLSYTILDFGARRGRIDAQSARVLASNFAFNDEHRKLIYEVQQAYYRLLNATAQEAAARASLTNAQAVEQAAEERLRNGLATLPDVLEARSAKAQSQYDLQAVLGAEQIARGDLATALGTSVATAIRIQPLDETPEPGSAGDTVEKAIDRALNQRPDLEEQVAAIRESNAQSKEARAAYYPTLSVRANPSAQSLFFTQQNLPSGHTADLTGSVALSLNWTVFDGGARKSRVAEAEARIRQAEAQVSAARDQIEDEVWAAYANVNTAFRQREAAGSLLEASTQSYSAALESYNYGVRNLLDVTAAQKVLAQARSADIQARTQVLASLSELAFRAGDLIQTGVPQTGKAAPHP